MSAYILKIIIKLKAIKKEIVDINISMRHFLVSSKGLENQSYQMSTKNENKLKEYQRKLSKKQKRFY